MPVSRFCVNNLDHPGLYAAPERSPGIFHAHPWSRSWDMHRLCEQTGQANRSNSPKRMGQELAAICPFSDTGKLLSQNFFPVLYLSSRIESEVKWLGRVIAARHDGLGKCVFVAMRFQAFGKLALSLTYERGISRIFDGIVVRSIHFASLSSCELGENLETGCNEIESNGYDVVL